MTYKVHENQIELSNYAVLMRHGSRLKTYALFSCNVRELGPRCDVKKTDEPNPSTVQLAVT